MYCSRLWHVQWATIYDDSGNVTTWNRISYSIACQDEPKTPWFEGDHSKRWKSSDQPKGFRLWTCFGLVARTHKAIPSNNLVQGAWSLEKLRLSGRYNYLQRDEGACQPWDDNNKNIPFPSNDALITSVHEKSDPHGTPSILVQMRTTNQLNRPEKSQTRH